MAEILNLQETATAECPASTITMSGTTEAQQTALAAVVSAYSDGYQASVAITNGGLYSANATYGAASGVVSVLAFAFGNGEITAAGAEFGAYGIGISRATTAVTAADTTLVFIPSGVAVDAAGATVVDMTVADSKYLFSETLGETGDAWADATVTIAAFYMPKEPSSKVTDTESSVGVADRLDKGDKLALWTGLSTDGTVVVAACNADDLTKVALGAATLAAGSAAFAAALAF